MHGIPGPVEHYLLTPQYSTVHRATDRASLLTYNGEYYVHTTYLPTYCMDLHIYSVQYLHTQQQKQQGKEVS